MARFNAELGNDILVGIQNMEKKADKVMGEMVEAGADVALRNVRANMRSSFKTTRSLEQGLGKTRVYKTPSDDGINVKVGFRGYNDRDVAVPLIAIAREKGTKRGERRKPFFKKAFNKSAIESAMKRIEPKLFEGVK